ncbi:TPA: hypothetical protein I1654_000028 [Staphylococcus pseudintermedius]|nr:hypothetical protein [Staphylococcus pseudintermedius]
MNDVVVLLIAGIGLVVLSYFADKYIFGNYERGIVYKLMIFIILILLASFFAAKDMLAVLIVMLFLILIEKLEIIVRALKE